MHPLTEFFAFSYIYYKQTIMKKVEATNDVVEIGKYVKQLSAVERRVLLKGLRKKVLLKEAKELSKSVNKTVPVSMEDILKEIDAVRKKHAA
jgi:Ni,Fe-hydrogenase maturation factor